MVAESDGLAGLQQRVLSQLLNEMDGIGERGSFHSDRLLVVGCTNRPQLIDSALLRPGMIEILCCRPGRGGGERGNNVNFPP